MKKTVALLLAVMMLTALLPFGALAANGEKLIAITYDDGPSQYTAQLLDGLKARGAKATFFLVGNQAQLRPNIVRREWMEGHQVANHTWDHPQLTKQSWSGVQSQVSRTDAMLDQAIGFDQTYMLRPPYGDYNQSVLNAAGVPAVFWSMDTADYKTSDASVVCSQIVRAARDGGICCIHDSHYSTVVGSLQAIDILQRQGYQCVTLEELFYRRGITPQAGTIYFNAYPGTTADRLSAPVISLSDADSGRQVSISGDSRAAIYYTLDGSQPTPVNSTRYTGPFLVTSTCTVRAVSVVKWNGLRTADTQRVVDYVRCPAPLMAPGTAGEIRMWAPEGDTIHYTANNQHATAADPVYDDANPPAYVKGTTYRAITTAPGCVPSAETMLTYTDNGFFLRDVSVKDWHYRAMDRALATGILKGVRLEYMAPNEEVTRAMMVTMLYRAVQPGSEAPAVTFSDTSSSAYYAEALNWAVEQGIVKGYDDGTFRPNQNISREELCTMVARYLKTRGIVSDGTDAISAFADADAISKFARAGMNVACQNGVVKGYKDGTVRPKATATRAEAVTMLLRAIDLPDPVPVAPESPVGPSHPDPDPTPVPEQPDVPETPDEPVTPVGPVDADQPLPEPIPVPEPIPAPVVDE